MVIREKGLIVAIALCWIMQGCAVPTKPVGESIFYPNDVKDYSEFAQYLTDVGLPVSLDDDGSIHIRGGETAHSVVARYLEMLNVRENVILLNIANARSVSDASLKNNPYRRRIVRWKTDHSFEIINDESPFICLSEPGHPLADANGVVKWPNVYVGYEMVHLQITIAERRIVTNILAMLNRQSGVTIAEIP